MPRLGVLPEPAGLTYRNTNHWNKPNPAPVAQMQSDPPAGP
jgi:hypothetical protein